MIHNPACRAQHCTTYAIQPSWMTNAVAQIRAGLYVERTRAASPVDEPRTEPGRDVPLTIIDGIGVVQVSGPMMKGWSKYAEADTLAIRRAVRMARVAPDVQGIMLLIDSPGGSTSGVQNLADEVAAAARDKPVHAHFDDLGASAAYWTAAHANRITANRTAIIGSIGAFAVIEDTSAQADALGVKVHVVQSGPMKAGAVDGVPVSDEVLSETQRIVDAFAAEFFGAVSAGRGLTGKALDAVTTGGIWTATEAAGLGLLDGVESFEAAMSSLRDAVAARGTPKRDSAAARLGVARRR